MSKSTNERPHGRRDARTGEGVPGSKEVAATLTELGLRMHRGAESAVQFGRAMRWVKAEQSRKPFYLWPGSPCRRKS